MILKWYLLVTGILSALTVNGKEQTIKETVEETEKVLRKEFCAKTSAAEAKSRCEQWVSRQKKNLGNRLLISWCSDRPEGDIKGCLYKIEGEITYLLRKKTIEKTVPR